MGVPADWIVLPLDVDRQVRDRRIQRLVEQHMGRQDELAPLRRRTVVRLRKSATEAVGAGGFLLAMHSRVAGGRPMSASALASLLPLPRDESGNVITDADAVAAATQTEDGGGHVSERTVVDLPVGRAARIRRVTASGIHGSDGREVVAENLQFYVPLQSPKRLLTLVFSTPILPLVDAYVKLFDTMAATAGFGPAGDRVR